MFLAWAGVIRKRVNESWFLLKMKQMTHLENLQNYIDFWIVYYLDEYSAFSSAACTLDWS